jgi:hypothetical protein
MEWVKFKSLGTGETFYVKQSDALSENKKRSLWMVVYGRNNMVSIDEDDYDYLVQKLTINDGDIEQTKKRAKAVAKLNQYCKAE